MKQSTKMIKLALLTKTDWRTDATPEEVRKAFDDFLTRHGYPTLKEMTYFELKALRRTLEEFSRVYGPYIRGPMTS